MFYNIVRCWVSGSAIYLYFTISDLILFYILLYFSYNDFIMFIFRE